MLYGRSPVISLPYVEVLDIPEITSVLVSAEKVLEGMRRGSVGGANCGPPALFKERPAQAWHPVACYCALTNPRPGRPRRAIKARAPKGGRAGGPARVARIVL